jgi:hypothetical protein
MLETSSSLSLLTLMEIVGPILLAAGLVYGNMRSRRSRRERPRADAATKNLYAQEDAGRRIWDLRETRFPHVAL